MSIELLKKDIREKKLRRVYLFYGQEDYLIRHYIGELEKVICGALSGPSADIGNLSRFDAEKNLSRIYDACAAFPLFVEQRMILIQNSGAFKAEKEKDSANDRSDKSSGKGPSGVSNDPSTQLTESVEASVAGKKAPRRGKGNAAAAQKMTYEWIVENSPDTASILMVEEKVDKRRKLYGLISKQGLVVEFPYQKPEDLERWVLNILSKNSKRIARNTLRMFMERNGESMTEIKNELDKLMLYTGNEQDITEEAVRQVCTVTMKTKVFDLMDSVTAGEKLKALAELDSLILMKEPIQKIMIMLSKHLVQMEQIKGLSEAGMSLGEITAMMKLNPYHAKILYRQCAKYGADQLKQAVQLCYERDLAVKNGKMEGILALESLIAAL